MRDEDPEVEDVLEIGHERRRHPAVEALGRIPPRIRYAVTAIAVTGAFVTGYIANDHGTAPQPAATASSAADVGKPDGYQTITLLAHQRGPFVDYVRATSSRGTCAVVPVGRAPLPGVKRAVRSELPAYRIRDVGQVLDQFTGLCSLRLRAVDDQGSILVLEVTSPRRRSSHTFVAETIGSRSDGRTVVTLASAVAPSGWSVTLGTVGPLADQPASGALLRLAENRAMHW